MKICEFASRKIKIRLKMWLIKVGKNINIISQLVWYDWSKRSGNEKTSLMLKRNFLDHEKNLFHLCFTSFYINFAFTGKYK